MCRDEQGVHAKDPGDPAQQRSSTDPQPQAAPADEPKRKPTSRHSRSGELTMELNLYRVIYLGGSYRDVDAATAEDAVVHAQALDLLRKSSDNRIVAVIDHYITTDAGTGDAHEEVVRFISADDSYYTV
ncbi:hypothetical protein SEA_BRUTONGASTER_142 [Gordonia phage BrutonGaster]|uniref:Uncharacterized protein n=1 Tax=Gordonia phage BrutonGaster TaxID=2530116 RepID=A0A482JLV0_9CAUD|nr:hypothetical protein HOV26_gp040 [Gordonia phage BrutonGaster]QBP33357.1 hypothetical protein SEA_BRUTONGASTER_142 [Gordonia phage BrutonGaster]